MRPGCRWRFDWFKDADYPTYVDLFPQLLTQSLTFYSATFTRVTCPDVLTAKTECVRNDDSDQKAIASANAAVKSAATNLSPTNSLLVVATFLLAILL